MTAWSQRSIVNVNFLEFPLAYAHINLFANSLFQSQDALLTYFNTRLDINTGLPNTSFADGKLWQSHPVLPASADFHGPWVLAWTGEGKLDIGFGFNWTEINAATATSTITSLSPDIPTATQNYFPFQKISFGTTRGNIIAGTTYVICPTGLTTTNIRVSATQADARAGIFITPSGGTGSSLITPKGFGSYTRNGNGNWNKVFANGVDCYVVFNGGATDFPLPILGGSTPVNFRNTGSDGHGNSGGDGFLKNLRWYRLADEDDLLAGNYYRRDFKQQLVSLNPSAIRFMNWFGGNRDINCRWENRIPPTNISYSSSWCAGPLYTGNTMPGDANQFVLAAVSTGVNQTPVSMVHGEVAAFQVDALPVRTGNNYQSSITNITNAATAVVSLAGHIYAVGDWVIHEVSSGMTRLNKVPVKITAVSAGVSYSFANPLGATLGTFAGAGSASVQAYVSLNVGTGSDRAPSPGYPILFSGGQYINRFADAANFLIYQSTLHFDKNVIGYYDMATGNPVYGAWLTNDHNQQLGLLNGVPPELITAMVNEINAMSVAQGITNPIHMYLNAPYRGLCSIDPDYSSGSNFMTNAVGAIINGNTYNGVTFPALTAAADVFVEWSNELWNYGPSDFCGNYLIYYSQGRWYTASAGQSLAGNVGINNQNGGNNYQDAQALRTACMGRDLKAAFPSSTRVHSIMGMISVGFFPGSFKAPYEMYYGSSTPGNNGWFYGQDAATSGWGTAGSNVNAVAIATYLDTTGIYFSGQKGVTGNTHSSTSVTNVSNTYNMSIGMLISGSGIPAGTTIAAIPSTTSLTLSNAATSTLNGVNLTISTGTLPSMTDDACRYLGTDNSGVLAITGGTGGVASTTFTTTLVVNGPPVVNQILVGAGINSGNGGTYITAAVGSGNVWTLTLSENATVTNGTVVNSPSNGGNNYIGAANQATALSNMMATIVDLGGDPGNTVGATFFTSSGGGYDQYSGGILAGQYVLQYEGGPNWPTTSYPINDTGNPSRTWNGHFISGAEQVFLMAALRSSQWNTTQMSVWNNFCTRPNCKMPAQYLWVNTGTFNEQGYPAMRWSYATPDTYASGIEGQQLLNAAAWVGASARNLGFGPESSGGSTNVFGFSVIHGHAKRHTKMIGY